MCTHVCTYVRVQAYTYQGCAECSAYGTGGGADVWAGMRAQKVCGPLIFASLFKMSFFPKRNFF